MIDLGREYETLREDLLAACARVFDRMHLLGGEEVESFETEMAAFLRARHVKGMARGPTPSAWRRAPPASVPATRYCCRPTLSWRPSRPSSTSARDPSRWTCGPAISGPSRGARTRDRTAYPSHLVVHLYGLPVEMAPILGLARERALVVLEDCSHAHGATLDGRAVGTFGDAGAFSLGVVKNLAAYGDAGIVSTDDDALAERVNAPRQTRSGRRRTTHVLLRRKTAASTSCMPRCCG